MLFKKLVSDYFSENSRLVFGKFSGNLKIIGKPWENDFGLINNYAKVGGPGEA